MNEGGEDNDEPSPAVVVTLLVAEDAHHERPLVSTHQPRHLKLGQREELDVELAFLRAEAPNLRARGNLGAGVGRGNAGLDGGCRFSTVRARWKVARGGSLKQRQAEQVPV